MILYREALSRVIDLGFRMGQGLESEWIPLAEARGRFLAEAISSPEDFPAFDACTVDGYALVSASTGGATRGAPLRFDIGKQIYAGVAEAGVAVSATTVVGVSTGAVLPEGADCAVKVEDVHIVCDADEIPRQIEIKSPLGVDENVRHRGVDIRQGLTILNAGEQVQDQHFPALAALGVSKLKVFRRPKVAVLCTGDEVVDASSDEPLPLGCVRNASGPFLLQALRGMGCDVVYYARVADQTILFKKEVEKVLGLGCDLVVTTGAVSVGQKDFVENVLKKLGAGILFHRSSIRPGKPALVAKVARSGGETAIFALPGNPMSTAVGLRFLVEPFLRSLRGQKHEIPLRISLGNDLIKSEGFRSFLVGSVVQTDAGLRVYVAAEQESFRVLTFARGNAWVVLPEVAKGAAFGDLVEVFPLMPSGTLGHFSSNV